MRPLDLSIPSVVLVAVLGISANYGADWDHEANIDATVKSEERPA